MRKVSISNRIRELRFNTGEMTQQQLADCVGITRQTIIALEQGKYSPSLDLAFLIAETFGVGVEEVFQHEDSGRAQAARKLRKSSGR